MNRIAPSASGFKFEAVNFEQFKEHVATRRPPGAGAPLQALWQDAGADWAGAHATVQNDPTADGAWVHAYLHRKEGDIANALYWYRRAGRSPPAPTTGFAIEWETIARALLAQQ